MLASNEKIGTINGCNDTPLIVAARSDCVSKFGLVHMWIIFWLFLLIRNLVVDVLNVTIAYIALIIMLCELSTKILHIMYHFVCLLSGH